MPRITRPQVYRVVREMLPREQFGPDQLLLWLEDTQLRNERARLSHERPRSTRYTGRMNRFVTLWVESASYSHFHHALTDQLFPGSGQRKRCGLN